ncbi:cyclic phosphodiesterase-like [Senna tora]|uniref:Cyclic phosphodiesterase-like n=1 Tax=Senna tora TaxID=362788 RepID=A0A834X960_9FABA|nr:cyclic phosphodiesterase-like [Senna tora]
MAFPNQPISDSTPIEDPDDYYVPCCIPQAYTSNSPYPTRRPILDDFMKALANPHTHIIGVIGSKDEIEDRFIPKVRRRIERDKVFDVVLTVTISKKPDLNKIQDEIAGQLGFNFNKKSKGERACEVLGRIKQEKNILVILLDVYKALDFEAIPHPESTKHVYSVWAVPPEEVGVRMKKLMSGLRSEFGGPEFEPHITVVGAISLTADDALNKFRSACEGLKAYDATVDRVATGTFFYQCVYLLIHPTTEVVETSDHCISHFGYMRSSPYMPHLSLLYADLSDEEKKKAEERANSLDDSLSGLSFKINRLALYKTDTEDKTLKSWEKIAECTLTPN